MLLSQWSVRFYQDLFTACSGKKKFLYMPNHSSAQLTKEQFYSLGRFPEVIGAINGTHIPIIAPSEDEHLFVNRKGFHFINVQVSTASL